MAGIFDNLADFFEGLFASDPKALRAKRALRDQAEALHGLRPPVYSTRNDQVLPGYAQAWSQVHTLVQPLVDIFSKTISSTDRRIQDLSLAYLIEASVGGVSDRRRGLGYEALKERLARISDVSRETTAINNEFTDLVGQLRKADTEAFQKSLEALYRLKALVGHPLGPFLARFGHDSTASSQQYHGADGSLMVTDLLDLYYVVEGLDVAAAEAPLSLLVEKMAPAKAAENQRRVSQLLGRLRDLLKGPCSASVLLSLIRVIQRNPDARPGVQRFTDSFLSTYIETLQNKFSQDRDRAVRERAESNLEADIATLFPGTPLLNLSLYNDESSARLTEAGLPSLSAVKPLQILRSFGFSVLQTGYLDAVKQVVLNGFFNDKDWAQKLSDVLYAAQEMVTGIDAFDQGLEHDAKTGFPALEKYVSGKVPPSSVPRQIIDKMNRTALALLEEDAQVLLSLAQKVQEILTDYKVPQPQFITNIKALGGKDQRALIGALVAGHGATVQLLKILRHFIVVK